MTMPQPGAITEAADLDGVRQPIKDFMQERFPALRQVDLDRADQLLEGDAIDSLGLLDLVAFLEETFGITFDDEELDPENFDSVDVLARLVAAKQTGA
ncbi:MAG: acyl carrier protein [Alphaproteobacteria bacterium]